MKLATNLVKTRRKCEQQLGRAANGPFGLQSGSMCVSAKIIDILLKIKWKLI